MVRHDNFETANRRAKATRIPRAVSARYDHKSGHIVINLSSRLVLSFSPHDAQGLEGAKPSQLDEIEISPSGFGIHFPKLDADLYLPGLLQGLLGSKKWLASRPGQIGRQSRSRAKRPGSKANRSLEGRPKKAAQVSIPT